MIARAPSQSPMVAWPATPKFCTTPITFLSSALPLSSTLRPWPSSVPVTSSIYRPEERRCSPQVLRSLQPQWWWATRRRKQPLRPHWPWQRAHRPTAGIRRRFRHFMLRQHLTRSAEAQLRARHLQAKALQPAVHLQKCRRFLRPAQQTVRFRSAERFRQAARLRQQQRRSYCRFHWGFCCVCDWDSAAIIELKTD